MGIRLKIVRLAWIIQVRPNVITRVLKNERGGAGESKEYITVKERQRDATLLALNMEKGSHEPRNEGSLYDGRCSVFSTGTQQ